VPPELATTGKNFVGSAVGCTYGGTPVVLNSPNGESLFETEVYFARGIESPSLNIKIENSGITGALTSDQPGTGLSTTQLQTTNDPASLEGEMESSTNGSPFIIRLWDGINQFERGNPTLEVCGELVTVEVALDGVPPELATTGKNFVGSAVGCTYGGTPVVLNSPNGESLFETEVYFARGIESPSLNIKIEEDGVTGELTSDQPGTGVSTTQLQTTIDLETLGFVHDGEAEPSPTGGPFIIRLWDSTNQFELGNPTLDICGEAQKIELTNDEAVSELTTSNNIKFVGSAMACASGETPLVLLSPGGQSIFETVIHITREIESPSFNIHVDGSGITGTLTSDGRSEGAASVAAQSMPSNIESNNPNQDMFLSDSTTDKILALLYFGLGLIIGGIIGWKADKTNVS
jgi:hypothetical protein